MAATFVTIPAPLFSLKKNNIPSRSNHRLLGWRKQTLTVNAIATKWEPTKVVPQADRVLVRLEQLPEKSAGGILLPKAAVKFERYLMGEILTVGADVGQVNAGKKVLFSDISAYEVDLGADERHCFVKESDLLAVVE
ncbi:10 kDa chaperonin 2 [Citrus sinensis]|uniref:10 kDa chaperonin 2 n=4 Tax=Citrus TaxID=2706 RepID=A0ACB8MUF5_CITSI|nr:10 kDa chaperonin 2, chloroplastic [Citrus x clementina]XP_006464381.1 10 kDa chaperonin 2, chloroplastic [Citrus sinensis]GAY57885.1 hypothetical protein CUMW_182900 [Citrus unshiu]ESR58715.1 hypothetical protein CICLE_v10022799mg [Citrus x clementina]KAH9733549.1 10 kDa chaperonin 2 [Citrus sinensis]KAH9788785.1 10 kDa chaperonin 2 [Citrus sinensis]KDO85418.1 hypothetical protein CISIN_1g032685mg [Citrus sinensis]